MSNACPNCGIGNAADEIVCVACGIVLPSLATKTKETTRPEIAVLAPEQARATLFSEFRRARPTAPSASARYDAVPPADLKAEPAGLNGATVAESEAAHADTDFAMPRPEEAPPIPAGAPRLAIGYDQDNDLVIPLPQVSGRHAHLALVDDRYVIEDCGSTNGTSVNGHQIARALVKPGDQIGLGSYTFRLDRSVTDRLRPSGRETKATRALEAPLFERPITIGRELDCDIVLDGPQISRHHARLERTPSGWRVEDLGSANGTFVNERHRPIESAIVHEDDVLFFGSYRFPVSRVRDFLDAGNESIHGGLLPLPLDKAIVTIGRGTDNDVVLEAPQVSRHHARLIRTDDGIFLEDLSSANGTFIGGRRITRERLEPGATVSFGSYAVRLDLDRGQVQRSYRGDILLQAENLRVELDTSKGPLRILDGVSFTVYPTEFVGLLGPSGSGKTTLLMALIGYLKPTHGRTLLNGDELARHYDRYRGAIGYVPQDDIIHRELTVFEALYYTAKLRLPPDTTDTEIAGRIEQVLRDLEIESTRDVRIGTPERKGISGGQRKRVNLALELLTEPSLLCLDEPTSGLASEDAINVVRLLRRLADGGRTILLTVHQPSIQTYRLLDNVLYIADGEQVYYGPAYPDSVLYFHPQTTPNTPQAEEVLADPGACMRAIVEAKRAGEPMETLAARYRQSRHYEEFVVDRRKNRIGVDVTGSGERRPPRFSLRQWFTLCRRYLTIRLKDRVGLFILLIQAPVIAILLNLVFMSETGGVMSRLQYAPFALFLLVVSAIWFGCSNAAREIVSEQAIYRRERMVNLSIASYVLSKVSILGGLCLVQCVILLSLTYFVLDFWGNPLYHLGILWLSSLAGVGMGLLLSALVRTSEAAMATVPLLLIPQIILGGAIMPVDRMSEPVWALSHVAVSRWAFEGALQAEHLADAYEIDADELPKPLAPGLPAPPPPPNPLDRFFADSETWLAIDFGVLGGFSFMMIFAVGGALRLRE